MRSKMFWRGIMGDFKKFPLFIDGEDKDVLVIGGGNIAYRRVKTLLCFGFNIKVISEEFSEEMKNLLEDNKLNYEINSFNKSMIKNQFLILACTDNRQVNYEIGKISKEKGIFVSVCDAKEECSFFFPAIAINENLSVGIVGTGNSHKVTKKAAKVVRDIIERKAY